MSVLQIVKYPSRILLSPAKPVEKIDDTIKNIVQDMFDTMYAAPGIGLAANQVGIPLQIAVIDIEQNGEHKDPRVLINPLVIAAEGVQLEEEGCLSVPGFAETVERPIAMKVSALTFEGERTIIEGNGLMARALSHEIDHLNGKVFIYHLSLLKRELIKKRIKKMMKSGEWTGVVT